MITINAAAPNRHDIAAPIHKLMRGWWGIEASQKSQQKRCAPAPAGEARPSLCLLGLPTSAALCHGRGCDCRLLQTGQAALQCVTWFNSPSTHTVHQPRQVT